MPLDSKKLDKPFLKLRKLVTKMSKTASQDEVHEVRTNTRKIEAILEALKLDRKRKGRRVLRAVTPIRKKAGDVRDMDVLIGLASTLSGDSNAQCLVKLLEHLGEERARGASKLRKIVAQRRKQASKRLRTCSSLVKKNFDKHSSKQRRQWPLNSTAAALRIAGELAKWPKLSSENLHPFRLKVKEMRYVLQLSGEDTRMTERLGQIKDQIGEWHDWIELHAIARDVLSDCKKCDLIAGIRETAKQRFETALRIAQELRNEYFDSEAGRRAGGQKSLGIKKPVLEAAAALVA